MVICYALLCCIQIQTQNPWCLIESFGRSSISEAEPLSRPLRCCHLDAWLRHSSPDMLNKPNFSQLWKPRNVRTGSNRNRGTLLERLPKSSNSSTSYLTQQLRLGRLLQYLSLPGNCLAQEGFCASMQQHWFISIHFMQHVNKHVGTEHARNSWPNSSAWCKRWAWRVLELFVAGSHGGQMGKNICWEW